MRFGFALGITLALLLTPTASAAARGSSDGFTNSNGGGINLAFAPPNLQACFGSSGWFLWNLRWTASVEKVANGTARFTLVGDLVATVESEFRDAVYFSGQTEVKEKAKVPTDPSTGTGEFLMPVRLKLNALQGRATLRVTIAFLNGIRVSGESASVAFVGAVPEYSNISCLRHA